MGENRYVEVNNLEVGNYITIWDVDGEFGRQTVMAVDDLQYLPPADVRPVVRGHWEGVQPEVWDTMYATCSCCRKRLFVSKDSLNYCPNCGAQMGGADE